MPFAYVNEEEAAVPMGSPRWASGPVMVKGFLRLLRRMGILRVRGSEVFPLLWAELKHLVKVVVGASERHATAAAPAAVASSSSSDGGGGTGEVARMSGDALAMLVDGGPECDPKATLTKVVEATKNRPHFPRSVDEPRTIRLKEGWGRDTKVLTEEETKQLYDLQEASSAKRSSGSCCEADDEDEEKIVIGPETTARALCSGLLSEFDDTGCLGYYRVRPAAGRGKLDINYSSVFVDNPTWLGDLWAVIHCSQGGWDYIMSPEARLLLLYVVEQDLTELIWAADTICRFRTGGEDDEITVEDFVLAEEFLVQKRYSFRTYDDYTYRTWEEQPLRRGIRRLVEATVGAARIPREDLEGGLNQVGCCCL